VLTILWLRVGVGLALIVVVRVVLEALELARVYLLLLVLLTQLL
jgi:hypothetical protein